MRVLDVMPSDKGPVAFEINSALGRRLTARIIARVEGVRILRRPRLFAGNHEEVFCEFVLQDQLFNAWEPFGDNSRYWIGPSNGTRTSVLLPVRQAFVDYKRPWSSWLAIWKRQGKGIL
jgi:hypothetical protein